MSTEPRARSSILTLTQKRRRLHLLALAMAVIAFLTVFGSIAAAVTALPLRHRAQLRSGSAIPQRRRMGHRRDSGSVARPYRI